MACAKYWRIVSKNLIELAKKFDSRNDVSQVIEGELWCDSFPVHEVCGYINSNACTVPV